MSTDVIKREEVNTRGNLCAGCGEWYSEWLVVQIRDGEKVRSTTFSPCCRRLQVSTRIADELVEPDRVIPRSEAFEQRHPTILNERYLNTDT